MHETKRTLNEDEITFRDFVDMVQSFIVYLKSKRSLVIIVGILGGLLGLGYSYFKKPIYTAECTFVLEEEGKGGLGAYAGIASMVGIDLGSGGGGLFQGDNIIELYRSRTMIEKTLLSFADVQGEKALLINRFIESNKLRKKWKGSRVLSNISFSVPRRKYTVQHDSIIGEIVEFINEKSLTIEKPDKKLSIISVKMNSDDELFAKAFTDKIVENVNDFYVQTKTKKSAENVKILQRQADSVRRVLNAAIGGTATAVDANPNANPAMQILRVPSQRRQVDVQASVAVYGEVVKNLEISKISLRKEAPLIQIIDRPILPLKKVKIGKVKAGIIGIVIAVFLAVIYLIITKLIRNALISD